jgi:hypothetical protein
MLKYLEKKYNLSLALAIVVALIIFYLSTLPSNVAEKIGPTFCLKPTIYHFVIFILFAFFLSIYFVRGKSSRINYIYIVILISLFYAITDEIHQFFVPGRHASIIDILIDFAGVLAGSGLYLWRMKK